MMEASVAREGVPRELQPSGESTRRRRRAPASGVYPCPADLAGTRGAVVVLSPFLRWSRDAPFLGWIAQNNSRNRWLRRAVWGLVAFGLVWMVLGDGTFPGPGSLLATGLQLAISSSWHLVAVFVISVVVPVIFLLLGRRGELRKRTALRGVMWGLADEAKRAMLMRDLASAGVGFGGFVRAQLMPFLRLDASRVIVLRTVLPLLVVGTVWMGAARIAMVSSKIELPELLVLTLALAMVFDVLRRVMLPATGALIASYSIFFLLGMARLGSKDPEAAKRLLRDLVGVLVLALALGWVISAESSVGWLGQNPQVYAFFWFSVVAWIGAMTLGRRVGRFVLAWIARRIRRWIREGELLHPAALEHMKS